MTKSNTTLGELLTQLRSLEVSVPEEVTACIEDHIKQPNVQYMHRMQVTSELTRKTLVCQLIASVNSGQVLRQSAGYMIFNMAGARLQRASTNDVHDAVELSDTDIQDLLLDVIAEFTSPRGAVDCRFYRVSDEHGYAEIHLAKSTPVYFHDPDEPVEPFIPVWRMRSNWLVEPASSEEITELFQIQLVEAFTDEPYSKRNDLTRLFEKYDVQSNTDFAGFLVSLLLRPGIEDRVLAARLLVRIGGISEKVKKLIAQLLTALLHDQPEVAIQAARSLEEVGSDDQVPLLMQSFHRYAHDRDVLVPVLACIGELGSAETIKNALELYTKSSDLSVKQAIDNTIVRLYRRHNLPLFSPVHRERFISQIEGFQYAHALDTVSRHGADLCLPYAHRQTMFALTQYADYRSKGQRPEAFSQLSLFAEEHHRSTDTLLGQITNQWLEDRRILTEVEPDAVTTPPEILAEMFYLADIEYLNRNHGGFVARLYNLVDQLSRHVLIKQGVALRRAGKYVYIDNTRNENNPAIVDFIGTRKQQKSIKVDRIIAGNILKALSDDAVAKEAHQLLIGFDELVELRHRLPIAHGYEAFNEELFVHAYGADFPTIIGDVRHFFKIATDYELGTNPFTELNSDIRFVLTSASSIEPSAHDLLARNLDH